MKFFNKIIKLFKLIFIPKNQKEEIEKLNKLLSEIEIGDMIWAKRYKNELEKKKIPKGHRKGPYIVLGKCDKGLICSSGTSVYHDKGVNKYFKLDYRNYNLFKESYFKLFQFDIIDPSSFIKKLDKLTKEDESLLFKEIKLQKRNYYIDNTQTKTFDMPLQVGDIIKIQQNYLIIDIKDDKMLCVPLYKATQYFKYNIQFKDFKTLDCSKTIWLDINDNIEYINTVNDNILLYTLRSYKEYIENQKKKTITQRGSIISKDNKNYYVYGEEGQEWLVFEIFRDNNENKEKIILGNKAFYTSYKDLKISKYDDFETLLLATEREMDNIKDQRKRYIKEQKNKEEAASIFKIGDIMETNYFKGQRFIIIKVCAKTYECLSINRIIEGIYDPILIRKADAKLSLNKSIEGIKWLEEQKTFDLANISKKGIIEQIIERQLYTIDNLKYQDQQNIESNNIETQTNNKVQRGCVITVEDRYYYVYGEEGQEWLTFEILNDIDTTKVTEEDLDEIKISDKYFYTNYKNMKSINKIDIVDVLLVATDEEIDIIKKNKKIYIKYRSMNVKKSNKKIDHGNCVVVNEEKYYVIAMINDIVACISVYDKGKKDCKMKYFNIKDVTIISEEVEEKVKKLK